MTHVTTDALTEKPRINSIDLMRGIVMVVMALDHTRDFFHISANVFDPTDLSKTTPVLFFTRWITHFCAPTFVLLSGVAARISLKRKTKKELSIFLLTRGLWLILLEVTIVRFGIFSNFYYDFILFQVIWVIGASMVVLSVLVFLPEVVVGAIGLLLVFGHNAFDATPLTSNDTGFGAWTLLNQGGALQVAPDKLLVVAYPLFPWLGILLTGFALGHWYMNFGVEKRRLYLLVAGLATMLLFLILRYTNLYGDPQPWQWQRNAIYSVISFLNCTKYPVSLMYTLMTLGPVLVVLSLMERVNLRFLNPFLVFGRVPLFYYILHFYLIHLTALTAYMIAYDKGFSDLDFHFSIGFGGVPKGTGVSLGWTYVAWLCIVVILYPVCVWYNQYKTAHPEKRWLSYL